MKIIDKIFGDKKTPSVIYILLAVGILFFVCGSVIPSYEKNTAEDTAETEIKIPDNKKEELEKILSEIKGAGRVSVMISTEDNGRKAFGYDGGGDTKKTVILNGKSGEEPLVEQEFSPEVRGVIIVADGAGNSSVKSALISAAHTITGIAPHKIVVFERKECK